MHVEAVHFVAQVQQHLRRIADGVNKHARPYMVPPFHPYYMGRIVQIFLMMSKIILKMGPT